MGPRVFTAPVVARSYEVDAAGVVNNAVFVNWLEHGRMEIFAELGVAVDRWLEQGVVVVVRRLELDYHAPARLGDRLAVESWVEEIGRTSVKVGQRIVRADGHLVLAARVIGVFVGRELRPIPIPEDLRRHFPPEAVGRRA